MIWALAATAVAATAAAAYWFFRRWRRQENKRQAEEARRRYAAQQREAEARRQELARQEAAAAERQKAEDAAADQAALDAKKPWWEQSDDPTAAAEDALDDVFTKLDNDPHRKNQADEDGHRAKVRRYDFNRDDAPAELNRAFDRARELLTKFANRVNFAKRIRGNRHWDAPALVGKMVGYQHHNIRNAKFDRPKSQSLVFLMDLSGSCRGQAEMFMAIASGVIGPNIRVYVGANSSAHLAELIPPAAKLLNYAQAKHWVNDEVPRVVRDGKEVDFETFLEEVNPETLIIFGDFDGIDKYVRARENPRNRKLRIYWFANVTEDSGRPKGFTARTYFPDIFTPQDFERTLGNLS